MNCARKIEAQAGRITLRIEPFLAAEVAGCPVTRGDINPHGEVLRQALQGVNMSLLHLTVKEGLPRGSIDGMQGAD